MRCYLTSIVFTFCLFLGAPALAFDPIEGVYDVQIGEIETVFRITYDSEKKSHALHSQLISHGAPWVFPQGLSCHLEGFVHCLSIPGIELVVPMDIMPGRSHLQTEEQFYDTHWVRVEYSSSVRDSVRSEPDFNECEDVVEIQSRIRAFQSSADSWVVDRSSTLIWSQSRGLLAFSVDYMEPGALAIRRAGCR